MTTFTPADLEQLRSQGLTPDIVNKQLERFRSGFPYLRIESPSSPEHGLLVLDKASIDLALERWNSFLNDGGDVLKFVPASGAASRMFKALFAFVNGNDDYPAIGSPVEQLINNISDFAFYGELQLAVKQMYGNDTTIEKLIVDKRYKDLIGAIILPDGLNYGQLPKALLSFHRYDDGSVRTALEEQLAEGAQTATSNDGKVRLHFTVSSNHRLLFKEKLKHAVPAMEKLFGVKYEVSLSEQKPSTDTIAVTPDNQLFRDDNGNLVFRPGGHGALIENLNDIDASVVFIKNIDNVVADKHRASTIEYKKIIGGLLIEIHDSIVDILEKLENPTEEIVAEGIRFCQNCLSYFSKDQSTDVPFEKRLAALKDALNRPLRVCGMVHNEGEPGGGPYNAMSSDGNSIAPQILESTQIDVSKPENIEMMKSAAYFNPVDLVCFLKRPDGSRFNLPDYVDHATGFISEKSAGGRDLRALELPGLWNGAMSNWNTVFVEVPATTFNPVKTVNDLLRKAHQ